MSTHDDPIQHAPERHLHLVPPLEDAAPLNGAVTFGRVVAQAAMYADAARRSPIAEPIRPLPRRRFGWLR